MRLGNKTAVIYGAGGGVGSAVARAFAREGATPFLSGRNEAKLEAIVSEIVDMNLFGMTRLTRS
jgi:3-oxoacyl-[acyl-carrier protein] reductase